MVCLISMPKAFPSDEAYFLRALALAERGRGHTRPNPPVGAVIVKDAKILGEGWHQKAGGDHAEVAAIKNAARRGFKSLKGATIYVTLEPCSKPGRVGACTDAIIAAGLARVVYATPDPNPINRGRAKRVLAKAGISCDLFTDKKSSVPTAARRLIAPFTKHVTTGLPFVTVKLALSLDGQICDKNGSAKWISSDASRKETGKLRTVVDAILVGAETVRKDNPSLLSHGKPNRDLLRVVVSKSGKLPKRAQIFTDGQNETLVFDDAKTALAALGKRGCLHVLCEGGYGLARSLADMGFVDEWITVLAPIVVGNRPLAVAQRFEGKDHVYRTYTKNRHG